MYTFGTTWTLNSTTVFDATYGISKMTHQTIAGDFSFGNYGLDTLGIPGMNGGANFSSDPRYAGIPYFITLVVRSTSGKRRRLDSSATATSARTP